MTTHQKTMVKKDLANKTIVVTREFASSQDKVWEAWTTTLLDEWWAPKPWKAITKSLDFKVGGYWLYCMTGPEGEQMWSRVDYLTIDANNSFSAQDAFSDEQGNKNDDFPSMHWVNVFSTIPGGTKVEVTITFTKEEDMNKILEMGFETGFSMGLDNLDDLLAR